MTDSNHRASTEPGALHNVNVEPSWTGSWTIYASETAPPNMATGWKSLATGWMTPSLAHGVDVAARVGGYAYGLGAYTYFWVDNLTVEQN